MSWAEFLTLATGSDRIPVELFQILKDDAVESAALNMQYAICTQYAICRLPAGNHGKTHRNSLTVRSRESQETAPLPALVPWRGAQQAREGAQEFGNLRSERT